MAPLVGLKQDGVIDRIVYVTWDDPALDGYLSPLADCSGVDLVRVKQPVAVGYDDLKGFTYQTANLEAALDLVPEPDALVIRSRPDFIFDRSFLACKILAADYLLEPSKLKAPSGVVLPPSPFTSKIWIPWADGNQPFFFEDGAFIGRRCDVAKLVDREALKIVQAFGDERCPWIVHVMRFIMPFLPDYPIFNRYLQNFKYFVQDEQFRIGMLEQVLTDPFYWHLLIAGAWILANNFHVDCGSSNQLRFYPGRFAKAHYGKPLDQIPIYPPYCSSDVWRSTHYEGLFFASIKRIFARLMNDTWQHSVFAPAGMRDVPYETVSAILAGVAAHGGGALESIENDFYGKLQQYYLRTPPNKAAA